MDNSLSEQLHKIEQDIMKIKAAQPTQNDSYQFYAYQSDNLYGQNWNTIVAEFIPDTADKSKVICYFSASGGQAVQYIEAMTADPNNPCKAIHPTASSWNSDLPSWTRYFYVTCYSNCRGVLNISFT